MFSKCNEMNAKDSSETFADFLTKDTFYKIIIHT